MHNYANVLTINQLKSLPGIRVVTSLDSINGWSIQTLLRGENVSKQSVDIQANDYHVRNRLGKKGNKALRVQGIEFYQKLIRG